MPVCPEPRVELCDRAQVFVAVVLTALQHGRGSEAGLLRHSNSALPLN
jgi:hypothetical protein